MTGRIRIALLSLAFMSCQAQALDRLAVEVVCQLAEERYRLGLTGQEIGEIEADCGRRVAELLGRRIGFLAFTGTPQVNRLVVRVGKSAAEADPDAFRPVDIDISAEGDNVTGSGEPVTWTFRALEEFLEVPPARSFADAIAVRFADELQKNEAHLVKAQLARLRIAESAYPLPQDQSWLLPFARGELGIADDSQLSIRAELEMPGSRERFTYTVALFGDFTAAAGVPVEFHNKVKALHLGDDKLSQTASLQRLLSASNVNVLHVSITRYVPAVELVRTSPSELDVDQ